MPKFILQKPLGEHEIVNEKTQDGGQQQAAFLDLACFILIFLLLLSQICFNYLASPADLF